MKILLDCCCGPCATHCIDVLSKNYEIILFVSNFNVHPKKEYLKRLDSIKKFAEIKGIPLEILKYRPGIWFKRTKGHEKDREGGPRCEICYELRLELAAKWAKEHGIKVFTTTLSISPHKNADIINFIGKKIASNYGLTFLESNFKKKDGFKKSVELSKKYGLYRQNYCGCIYSKR
ncbi:MAG: epoxyqueuosine reductase QueH [Candidatus Helarchaeota archaeon]